MPESKQEITFKFGELGTAANTFVDRMFDFVDDWCDPVHTIRNAKAIAKAEAIAQKSRHDLSKAEARFQKNMANIAIAAVPLIAETAKPSDVEEDWLTNFFEKAKLFSDEQMQSLWSRILAGEVNEPGRFSRRTINWLADFDKADAELIESLCRFAWNVELESRPLIFDWNHAFYTSAGLTFDSLSHLESVGVITFATLGHYHLGDLPAEVLPRYFDRTLPLNPRLEQGTTSGEIELDIGKVAFTRLGRELAPLVECRPIDGFFDYVANHWQVHVKKSDGISPESSTQSAEG